MSKKLRNLLAILKSFLGTLLALYVGVYKLIIMNLVNFVSVMHAGGISITLMLRTIGGIIISMTLAGAIWVACDILASKIRGIE